MLNNIFFKTGMKQHLLLIIFILFTTQVHADKTCPAISADNGDSSFLNGLDVRSGTCGNYNLNNASYDSAGSGGFADASFPFTAFLPDLAPSYSAARFVMHDGTNEVSFSVAICDGATISSLNTTHLDITLPNNSSCSLTIGDSNVGYTDATLSRTSDGVYLLSIGTLKGGSFGGTFTPPNSTTPVNLSVSTNSGTEVAATIVTVTATADSAVSGDQTVSLGVSGTGITAGDYTLSDTIITIPDGNTTGSVTFTVVNDSDVEGSETATLTISNPSSGLTLGSTTTQDVDIADDDNLLISNDGNVAACFYGSTSVEWQIVDWAFAGECPTNSGVIGDSGSAISVSGTPQKCDADQYGAVASVPASGGIVGSLSYALANEYVLSTTDKYCLVKDGYGKYWAFDSVDLKIKECANSNYFSVTEGCKPVVEVNVSTNSATEADTTVITVTATADSAVSGEQTVDVNVTGTGITAGDYTLSDTTITIPDGDTTGSVTFTVQDDSNIEINETATLSISNPSSGLALGAITEQNITIADNDEGNMYSCSSATDISGSYGTVSGVDESSVAMQDIVLGNSCYTSDDAIDSWSDFTNAKVSPLDSYGLVILTLTLNTITTHATYSDTTPTVTGFKMWLSALVSDFKVDGVAQTSPYEDTSITTATAFSKTITFVYDGFKYEYIVSKDANSDTLKASTLTRTLVSTDTTPPTITAVSIPNTSMKIGDTVTATITVSSDDDNYSSGSGGVSGTIGGFALGSLVKTNDTTYTATFSILSGGTDVSPPSDIPLSIKLTDSSGNQMPTAYTTAISQWNDPIDAHAPSVASVSVPSDGTYGVGNDLNFTVNTSENVTVNTTGGTPRLTLTIGSTTKYATYVSGSGGSALLFSYTVESGLSDIDGIAVAGTIDLNSGTMRDAVGNNLNTTLYSLGSTSAVLVDSIAPSVTNVSASQPDGYYGVGDNMNISVTFSEDINVTGTPQLTLETGSTDRVANYTTTMNGNTLYFTYVVQAGDSSLDLDYIALNPLTLNGGTIQDTGGNDANLTLSTPGSANSLGANKTLVIDTAAPTLLLSHQNITIHTADLNATSDENSKIYYVVATSSSNPSANDVMSNSVADSIQDGNSTVTANNATIFNITGLDGGVTYYYYLVAVDTIGNKSTVADGNFTTNNYTLTIAKTTNGSENNSGSPTDAVFTVTLTPANSSGAPITGDIAYSGSATNGIDYNPGVTSFSIANGASEANITLGIKEDSLSEGNESITATISNSSKGTITTNSASAILIDDESVPTLSVNDINITEGNTSTKTLTLSVTPSHASTSIMRVDYVTANSSATAGEDYTSASGTLNFPANSTSEQNITVTIQGDWVLEDNESFFVNFSNLVNAQMSDSSATLTILNDDSAGFTLSKTTSSVNESGTTDSFGVVLNSQPSSNVVLSLSSNDTGEVTVSPATLTFTPSDWNVSQVVTLTGVDDLAADGNQNSSVTVAVVDGSSDDGFDALPDQNVSVTTVDNDVPAVVVTPTTLTVNEPTGSATFSIKLQTPPTNDVNITTIAPSNAQCSVSVSSLLISSANWNVEHNITVSAVNDANDGNQTCMVELGTTSSSDSNYNGLNPDDVNVTVVSDYTPTSSDFNVSVNEDSAKTFASSDFPFSDGDGDSLANLIINTLPSKGSLRLNGNAVSANEVIPVANIANLSYTPVTNESGDNYSNFTFKVNDGEYNSSSVYTATINVVRVVDSAPDAFSFTALTNQELNTPVLSNSVTLENMDNDLNISIVGGEYRINGGVWSTASSSVDQNDTIQVRVTTSSSYSTKVTATLTVGTVSASFDATTKARLVPPNVAPTIQGLESSLAMDDNQTIAPFANVELSDSNKDDLSIALSLENNATGTLSSYAIASAQSASVQSVLRTIVFTPYENIAPVGESNTTVITLELSDGKTTTTRTIEINATSINYVPQIMTTLENREMELEVSQNIEVQLYDRDMDDLNLTISSDTQGVEIITHFTNPIVDTDYLFNSFAFDLKALESGEATVTLRLNDGITTTTQSFSVTVPEPTPLPTIEPTEEPTAQPTQEPVEEVTQPTTTPTTQPTEEEEPNEEATATPTQTPTQIPTQTPTSEPEEIEEEVNEEEVGNFIQVLQTIASFHTNFDVDFESDDEQQSATITAPNGKSITITINNNSQVAKIVVTDPSTGKSKTSVINLKGSQTAVDEEGSIVASITLDSGAILKLTISSEGKVEHIVIYQAKITEATSKLQNAFTTISQDGNLTTQAELSLEGILYRAVITTTQAGESRTKFVMINIATGEVINLAHTLRSDMYFEHGSLIEIMIMDGKIYIKTKTPMEDDLVIE